MKNNILRTIKVLIFLLLILTGCKKNEPENMMQSTEHNHEALLPPYGNFEIDLDQNGEYDIKFFFRNLSVMYGFIAESIDDKFLLTDIIEKDSINEKQKWTNQIMNTYGFPPDSLGNVPYFGFRKELNGSIYYGWILAISNKQGYYIKKTAFCTVPNQPILAGQEFLFLEE